MTHLSRRGFTGTLAAAALAPLLHLKPSERFADGPVPAAPSPQPDAEAKALAAAVEARYGAQLAPNDLAVITDQVQSGIRRAGRMQQVPLANGDEPDFVFAPPAARRSGE